MEKIKFEPRFILGTRRGADARPVPDVWPSSVAHANSAYTNISKNPVSWRPVSSQSSPNVPAFLNSHHRVDMVHLFHLCIYLDQRQCDQVLRRKNHPNNKLILSKKIAFQRPPKIAKMATDRRNWSHWFNNNDVCTFHFSSVFVQRLKI